MWAGDEDDDEDEEDGFPKTSCVNLLKGME